MLLGATLGVLANYFYRKNEDKIKDKATNIKDDLEYKSIDFYDNARTRTENILNKLETMFLKTKNYDKEKLEEIKNDFRDIKENSKDIAKTSYQNASQTVDSVSKEVGKVF